MSGKLRLIIVIFMIHVIAENPCTSFSFRSLKSIIKLTRELYKVIRAGIKAGKIIESIVKTVASVINDPENSDEQYVRINSELIDISSQLSYMLKQMEEKFRIMERKIDAIPLELEIGMVKRRIAELILNIKRCYEKTVQYSNELEYHNRAELENLLKLLIGLDSDKNPRTSLESLFNYITQPSIRDLNKNFLDLYEEYVETKKLDSCGDGLSPNDYLYNLYVIITSTEMMGLISLSFGYELQYRLYNCSVYHELRGAQIEREKRLTQYFLSFQNAMKSAPLHFRSCDPRKHIRRETFFEMEGLYQDLLIPEIGHNKYDSCHGVCSTINLSSYENDNGVVCRRVFDCWTIPNPKYCELSYERRIYQWIQDRNGYEYGTVSGCTGTKHHFRSYLYYASRCDACWCTCEGSTLEAMNRNSYSTHVVSLLPATSDISNNLVITGVRFVVHNGIVHIQIKEGLLQDMGQIKKYSETWKRNPDMGKLVTQARRGSTDFYKYNEDFVVIDKYHNAINLDDITVPAGNVITGIKFGLSQKKEVSLPFQRLEIQVQYMPFDIVSGALHKSSGVKWMSSPVSRHYLLNTARARNPERSSVRNIPIETSNSFIKFGPSIWKEDIGQTTIPFLDGVAVETGSNALSGVGLFYKGCEGYGGFLSFRLYSLNFSQYMIENRNDNYEYFINETDEDEDEQTTKGVVASAEWHKSDATIISESILWISILCYIIVEAV